MLEIAVVLELVLHEQLAILLSLDALVLTSPSRSLQEY